MKPGPLYDRVVDVMEELTKLTLLTRERSAYLTDRYSERRAEGRPPAGAEHLTAFSEQATAAFRRGSAGPQPSMSCRARKAR